MAVRKQDVVSHLPALPARVALGALRPIARPSRRMEPGIVAQDGRAPWLIERDPMLTLRDGLEHDLGVVREVQRELLLAQQAAVALVQSVGQVPVEQRDHGRDAGVEQVIDELDVEAEARLVNGVVAAAQRDDARPGDGEAVGLGAGLLEELDVLGGAVVGVAGDVAGAGAGDLAGNLAEGVPDGGAASVGFGSAFNLVAVWRVSTEMGMIEG